MKNTNTIKKVLRGKGMKMASRTRLGKSWSNGCIVTKEGGLLFRVEDRGGVNGLDKVKQILDNAGYITQMEDNHITIDTV